VAWSGILIPTGRTPPSAWTDGDSTRERPTRISGGKFTVPKPGEERYRASGRRLLSEQAVRPGGVPRKNQIGGAREVMFVDQLRVLLIDDERDFLDTW